MLIDVDFITQKQIITKIKMPPKTVRYALNRLIKENLVLKTPNLEDMRSTYYSLNPHHPGALSILFWFFINHNPIIVSPKIHFYI